MFDDVDNKTYPYVFGFLLLSASLLGLLFLLLVKTALIGLGSFVCLCFASMALYVIIIILLSTSGIMAMIKIEYDLISVFSLMGFMVNVAVTIFMLFTLTNSSYGTRNITIYSGLAFLSILTATILLFIALIYIKKVKFDYRKGMVASKEHNQIIKKR